MANPPNAGAATIHQFVSALASDTDWKLSVWNHTKLVTNAMARSSAQAAATPPAPTSAAMPIRMRTRRSVVKSPSRCNGLDRFPYGRNRKRIPKIDIIGFTIEAGLEAGWDG